MSTTAIQIRHASGLHAVASELGRLHERQVRGGPEDERAMRLSVLTLVAVTTDDDAAETAAEAVALLAGSHPARAIIIVASRHGRASIEADLSLHEGSSGHHVEQVRLSVTGEPALHLGTVVAPLLIPDVPVYLWMVGAPPLAQAFGQDAIALCERLIIDTGAYDDPAATLAKVGRQMSAGAGIAIEDLAWARTRTWREVIAQSFDGVEVRRYVRGVERVTVNVAGDGVPAGAWLLLGWLASRLQWGDATPRIDVASRPAEGVADGEIIGIRLDCIREGGRATVRVERHEGALYSGLDVDGTVSASRTMPLMETNTAQLVGGLLEEAGEDPVYGPAVTAAAVLAARHRT